MVQQIWLKGKDPKQIEAIKFALENNTTLIETLKDILVEFEAQEARAEWNAEQYDSPSWAYKQADRNGAMRVIQKIRNLFKEPKES